VLDTFIATHSPPNKIVLVGQSMGGNLAPRAAAFEPRIDGVVSYDILFDLQDSFSRGAPRIIGPLRRVGLDRLVDALAALRWRASTLA
jgi:alpha-beta hydrolase superfamily lysophospholipase